MVGGGDGEGATISPLEIEKGHKMKQALWIRIGLFLFLFQPTSAFSQESASAKAVRVIDGDTIIMMVDGKKEWVNLLAVDAPESAQPWGLIAAAALKMLVDGKDIRIEFDEQRRRHDGRMWGYLWVGGTFVNREMVLNGYALWDFWPPNIRYDDTLLDAEFAARKNWKGIWKSPKPSSGDAPFSDGYDGEQ